MHSYAKGHGKGGRALWALRRTKLELPAVLVCCGLFFLVGFFGSKIPSADLSSENPYRLRLLELEEVEMPPGKSGEDHASELRFQVLSWKPRAVYYPKFASKKQCEAIIKMAKGNLMPSTLALRKGENTENTEGIRTSSGTFISASEDPSGTLASIEQKIARATMIPRDHGEEFNILRYEIGQRYASHYDAFNPAEYGPQKSQRVASFLLYLSDVEEGGETMFPYEDGSNMNTGYGYTECIGLKVKPRQGDGLLFYSVFTNGTIDSRSLHGSCPVIKGEKWVATKWIRDQVQD
uniref:procollagen-proline 4-dioxygenase n=1 Tax=Anthurium amnicola TaxID=1678845 RepID=A0A1D1ZCT7_9ARAE